MKGKIIAHGSQKPNISESWQDEVYSAPSLWGMATQKVIRNSGRGAVDIHIYSLRRVHCAPSHLCQDSWPPSLATVGTLHLVSLKKENVILTVAPQKDYLDKSLFQQWSSPGHRLCLSFLSFQYTLNSRRKIKKLSPLLLFSYWTNPVTSIWLLGQCSLFRLQEQARNIPTKEQHLALQLAPPTPRGSEPPSPTRTQVVHAFAPVMLNSNEYKPPRPRVERKKDYIFYSKNNSRST